MTAVLRHIAKHRPNWIVDYVADVGRHSAAFGLVRNAFSYDDPLPSTQYDREIDIVLYDTFAGWTDRPNTRVTSCLHEKFGMEWDRECSQYVIKIQSESWCRAHVFMQQVTGKCCYKSRGHGCPGYFPFVAIQYSGDSSQPLKNLTHEQAKEICQAVIRLGRVPLLMDWRNLSPLPDQKTIHTTGRLSVSDQWGKDAQMNAAIISQCEAFVGIDSGPGKCASATQTPTLICWTGHHPALFHDPAENTTHLVPTNHRDNPLLQGNADVANWFEDNYNWMTYCEGSLTQEVNHWLEAVLK